MRICKAGIEYIFRISDKQSRDKDGNPTILEIRYRLPTTEEHQEYINRLMQNVGGKIVSNHAATRLTMGAKIITGIQDGCFGRLNEDGREVPMSSDKKSPDYFKEWKEALMDGAGDIVGALGCAVFETSKAAYQTGVSAEKN